MKYFLCLILLCILATPNFSFAYRCYDALGDVTTCPAGSFTLGSCYTHLGAPMACPDAAAGGGDDAAKDTGGGGSVTITNPLGDKTLMEFFTDILSVILVFAVPLIVFFIIYAGFMYVMAQGKPEEIKTASRALLYAIIGGLIILGAWIILEVIQGTIDAFTG